MIELAYASNMYAESLTEIDREIGGINGSAVGYVHSRMQKKLKENTALKKIFTEARDVVVNT